MSESEMDLDATFTEQGKRAGPSTDGTPPAKRANTMKALATSYQNCVSATKAKLLQQKTGSAVPVPLPESSIETEMFHEMVEQNAKPVEAPSYAKAPIVTLRQLMLMPKLCPSIRPLKPSLLNS